MSTHKTDEITPAQFDSLAQLLRLRPGPAREAARLVLVAGLTAGDAGRAAGIEYRFAHRAAARARRGLELARSAAG